MILTSKYMRSCSTFVLHSAVPDPAIRLFTPCLTSGPQRFGSTFGTCTATLPRISRQIPLGRAPAQFWRAAAAQVELIRAAGKRARRVALPIAARRAGAEGPPGYHRTWSPSSTDIPSIAVRFPEALPPVMPGSVLSSPWCSPLRLHPGGQRGGGGSSDGGSPDGMHTPTTLACRVYRATPSPSPAARGALKPCRLHTVSRSVSQKKPSTTNDKRPR